MIPGRPDYEGYIAQNGVFSKLAQLKFTTADDDSVHKVGRFSA